MVRWISRYLRPGAKAPGSSALWYILAIWDKGEDFYINNESFFADWRIIIIFAAKYWRWTKTDMSAINDLIAQIEDEGLRQRIDAEVKRLLKQKKFGLVFKEHQPDGLMEITNELRTFNRERDWEQFHDAKNLALSISIEASELNECFLWKKAEEADRAKVEEELADVFLCAIMLADKYDIDIKDICLKKIEKNAQKYPVEKAKGKATKYDEL